jgi:hypothetical protein
VLDAALAPGGVHPVLKIAADHTLPTEARR